MADRPIGSQVSCPVDPSVQHTHLVSGPQFLPQHLADLPAGRGQHGVEIAEHIRRIRGSDRGMPHRQERRAGNRHFLLVGNQLLQQSGTESVGWRANFVRVSHSQSPHTP